MWVHNNNWELFSNWYQGANTAELTKCADTLGNDCMALAKHLLNSSSAVNCNCVYALKDKPEPQRISSLLFVKFVH